eukprot:230679_1
MTGSEKIYVSVSKETELPSFLKNIPSLLRFESVLNDIEQLKILEEKTGLARVKLALISIVVVCAGVLVALGSSALSSLVGFVYPTYCSFKALQSEGLEDDSEWLTYWVVYAFFSTFESMFGFIVSWFPLYFWAKIIFLAYLMAPQTQGAKVMYTKFVCPTFKKYEQRIDDAAKRVKNKLSSAADDLVKSDAAGKIAVAGMHLAADVANKSSELAAAGEGEPGVNKTKAN